MEGGRNGARRTICRTTKILAGKTGRSAEIAGQGTNHHTLPCRSADNAESAVLIEVDYYQHGGILSYVLRELVAAQVDVSVIWNDDMRTTVNLDETLLARAHQLSGLQKRGVLLHAALTVLIERESARRLADMGGSEPDWRVVERRQLKAD